MNEMRKDLEIKKFISKLVLQVAQNIPSINGSY